MLSRHFLRAKVLQSLYMYSVSKSDDLPRAETGMLKNIDSLYDLYIYQLSTLTEVIQTVELIIQEGKQKFFPTEEEKNPNLRFVENKVGLALSSNKDFIKKVEKLKINWAQERDIFRSVFNLFRNTGNYHSYMSKESVSFDDEKKIMLALFKELMNFEPLQALLIEKNLLWEDDFFQIAQLTYKTIKDFDENFCETSPLPHFFEKNEETNSNDDKDFIVDLLRKTILHSKELEPLIEKRIQNWDFDRIAQIDILIVKMALVEFMYFSSIPTKVTLNEYVELSKEFSTEKSKLFVNGILDRLLIDLKADGKLKKTGRGLMQ